MTVVASPDLQFTSQTAGRWC